MKYLKSSYQNNNTLAVLAQKEGEDRIYGVVTVNLAGSDLLPDDSQFVDENNWNGIVEQLEKEGVAKKLKDSKGEVVVGHSGFCDYTAMKFDMSKLTEVKNG
jgi:hypothetical protein